MSLINFSAQLVFDFYMTCPAGFCGTKISVLKVKKDLKGRSKKHQRPIGWKKLMRDLNGQGSKHEGLKQHLIAYNISFEFFDLHKFFNPVFNNLSFGGNIRGFCY